MSLDDCIDKRYDAVTGRPLQVDSVSQSDGPTPSVGDQAAADAQVTQLPVQVPTVSQSTTCDLPADLEELFDSADDCIEFNTNLSLRDILMNCM